MDLKTHFRIALVYLLIISLLGVVLRHFQVSDIPINYKFMLHAHSHVALLGWVYTALTTIIYKLYLEDQPIEKNYKRLFWYTQITILGMMVTFPFTGYAFLSIIFSTLFLIASYGFIFMFLKYTSKEQKNTYSYKWIRASLWFMVFSSIGPWVLGAIMNTVGGESPWYRNAIYFYLHFQYNGWFLVALLGIFFYQLEKFGFPLNRNLGKIIYGLFNTGVILTFFLSVLWMKPHMLFYTISGLGGFLQIISFALILKLLFMHKEEIKTSTTKLNGSLLKMVALLFLIKILFQLVGAFPVIAEIVSTNKDLIIVYLHWVFLGIVSISIFAFANKMQLMFMSKKSFLFYFFGFIITEGFIFYKGIIGWINGSIYQSYFNHLFIASTILFLGVVYILYIQKKRQVK